MKREKIFFILIVQVILMSCSKTTSLQTSASLNIINAINFSNPIVTNFNSTVSNEFLQTPLQYYATASQIGYGNSWESGSYEGAVVLSLAEISDTLNDIWSGTLSLKVGSIHTLFLCGDTTAVDTLFTTDIVPYYPYSGDSLTGVRFINLVVASGQISVDIQESPNNIPVLSSLSYKKISAFQTFSANTNAQNNGYNFEFRDANGNVVASYLLNILPFKCQTLALYGNSILGYSIMCINNY